MRRALSFLRPRRALDWPLLSRILAAVVGGYGVTVMLTLLTTALLALVGVRREEALFASTMGSFLLFAAIVMGVFHAASATRAWVWLTAMAAAAALILWVAPWGGPGT